ncbi:MAG: alpha-amylase family glycosyl hydrolase [Flavobacteriaceae bacterium]|nr:alpha-amylase family glycosyl hydrolase [Flavobacteriaceae bacterium]
MNLNHLDQLTQWCSEDGIKTQTADRPFWNRLMAEAHTLHDLFFQIYGHDANAETAYRALIRGIAQAYGLRSKALKSRDAQKAVKDAWITDQNLVGMSLYVDRFGGDLKGLVKQLDYLEELGVNALHLLPVMKSPAEASDGGYAVSDYRSVDPRFGSDQDLADLQQELLKRGMYLMTDIVVNHTSDQHPWALKAKAGDPFYQSFYYTYADRTVPDQMEATMPEVFPESAPGSFTFNSEMNAWVMTVFHHYQWDLKFSNPQVLHAMVEHILYYGNLGVDILRIDAPAFIWKQMGTTCQNLPQAHLLLQLIKSAVRVATPGMAILGEAILAPEQIMDFFGHGLMQGRECDLAYNAAQMALQWDALATGNTTNLRLNQAIISRKPLGTTWLNYTRCHDDIGFGFEDKYIEQAGFTPYLHRAFLKDYWSGQHPDSPAKGMLFGVNPKTNDARISGTLASLCGVEKALELDDTTALERAIARIALMQAQCLLLGGIPMLYYGDELGHINDYSFQDDPSKSYDNRWVHRPIIRAEKRKKRADQASVEGRIFALHQKLIALRKAHDIFADTNNVEWWPTDHPSVIGMSRGSIHALFHYGGQSKTVTLSGRSIPQKTLDLWTGKTVNLSNEGQLTFAPYQFYVLQQESSVRGE